jgi:hypothetical protein
MVEIREILWSGSEKLFDKQQEVWRDSVPEDVGCRGAW